MKTIRYGLAVVHAARIITAADFKSVDVEDQGKVTWDASNGFTAEVSDAAAEYLLSKETNFVEIKAGSEEVPAGEVETQVTVDDDTIGGLTTTPTITGPEPIVVPRRVKDTPQA